MPDNTNTESARTGDEAIRDGVSAVLDALYRTAPRAGEAFDVLLNALGVLSADCDISSDEVSDAARKSVEHFRALRTSQAH